MVERAPKRWRVDLLRAKTTTQVELSNIIMRAYLASVAKTDRDHLHALAGMIQEALDA